MRDAGAWVDVPTYRRGKDGVWRDHIPLRGLVLPKGPFVVLTIPFMICECGHCPPEASS